MLGKEAKTDRGVVVTPHYTGALMDLLITPYDQTEKRYSGLEKTVLFLSF